MMCIPESASPLWIVIVVVLETDNVEHYYHLFVGPYRSNLLFLRSKSCIYLLVLTRDKSPDRLKHSSLPISSTVWQKEHRVVM